MASVRSIKSALEEESDDLTHCCICMEQFDNGLHKPKFLICHHTLCLQCIKKMIHTQATTAKVTCPVCKTSCEVVGVAERLPTNMYALNIVQLMNTSSGGSSWCLVCRGAPKKDCQGFHTVVDMAKDAELLESLLEDKSAAVDNYLNEAVAKREQTNEHLLVLVETFKSMAEQNAICIKELRNKIEKGVETKYLVSASQQAAGFGSIMKDLEKAVQEAREEVKGADRALHQVVSTTRIASVESTQQKPVQMFDCESMLKLEGAVAATFPSVHSSTSGSISALKVAHIRNGFSADRLDANQTVHCKDLTGHSSLIRALEFSDDESLLVSGGRDDRVLIWNMNDVNATTPTVLKVTPEEDFDLFALAISPDNSRIIVGGGYPDVLVYDTQMMKKVNSVPHDSHASALALQPGSNGQVFGACCHDVLRIFDTRSTAKGSVIEMVQSQNPELLWSVMFSPSEPNLVVTSGSKVGALLHDIRFPNCSLQLFANSDGIKSARFNGNGTRLLCSEVNQPLAFYGVPNGRSDKEWLYCSAPGYTIGCNLKVKSPCCFAGDEDELVVCASDDNNIYVWSADTNPYHRTNDRPLRVLRGHRDIVRNVRYSIHNGLLASCGEEGVVKLWSTQSF